MKVLLTLLALLAFYSTPAISDTLLIDVIQNEPANSAAGIPRPTYGMSMIQVKETFGSANKEYPAVGIPPITRWNYEKFSVYFEDNTVLHSVINKPAISPAK